MATFACSHCGAKITHNPALVGKRAKCPKCGQPILVPELPPNEPALIASSVHPPVSAPSPPPPITPSYVPPAQPTVVLVGNQEPRLEAGGWFARAFTTTSGIVIALIVFGLAAVGVPVLLVCGGCLMFANQVGESIEKERIANSPRPVGTAATDPDAASPAPDVNAWHPHDQPLAVGDVVLRIASVTRGKVPLVDFRGEGRSQDDLLIVRITVENVSPNKKVDFQRWNMPTQVLGPFATLTDDAGNAYKRIGFGFGNKIDGLEDRESIYPGKTAAATLVFELPVDAATELQLILPAKAVGGQGEFRFALPATAIAPEPPA